LSRCDRLNRIGGGVAVYTSDNIHITTLSPSLVVSPKCSESVWLHFTHHNLVLVCIYIPPGLHVADHCQITSFLSINIDSYLSKFNEPTVLICGDFNDFHTENICSTFNLKNVVTEPTRKDAIIDKILIPKNLSCTCETGPPLSTSDHNSILADVSFPISVLNPVSKTVYDLRKRFISNFVDCIVSFDWNNFANINLDVNEKCKKFQNFIETSFHNCIPKRIIPISTKDKPWITPFIKHLIHDRWSAYRCRNFIRYRTLSNLIKTKIIEAKRRWASRSTNPSDLWNKIRTVTGTSQQNPLASLIDSFSNLSTAANAINNHFNSVFVDSNIVNTIDDNHITWDIIFTANSVKNAILKHSVRKATGSDGIPIVLYHSIADVISEPLAHLYNLSVQSTVFPNRWKHSHVIPVPKCKSPTIGDLRPISILNFCGKIFETIVYNHMKSSFFPLYGNHQFGFREHCSTTTALIALHNHATYHLDSLSVLGVQIFALDYSKAFDKLRFDVIVKALVDSQLPHCFVKWITTYLVNRTQCTRLNDTLSCISHVTSGVPQGSILGPALFNIVIGFLSPVHSSTGMFKYADDITLSIPIFKSGNNVTLELNNVFNFSLVNGLFLNFDKCNYIFISFKSNCLPIEVENIHEKYYVKVLGIHFTNDLKWDFHFEKIIKKANQRFYAIRILKPFLNVNDMIHAYSCFIRSLLEYCSPLFIGLNKKTQIA
jgi:hypothetical protein